MSRMTIWMGFLFGSVAYQLTKIVFGFTPDFGAVFNCVYWTGGAFLVEHVQQQKSFWGG